jgi:hypothetical protein
MNKFAVMLLLSFVMLCAAENTFALGKGEKDASKPQKVEVSGKIRMVGNSPMTMLVISGENREWYVKPEEQEKLMHLQQQIVTVKAKEYYYDMVFFFGSSAGRHYYLKDIVLVNQKKNFTEEQTHR